jgi:8-oxo-dGTP pyrophosphatase MutT (NUDIX family)
MKPRWAPTSRKELLRTPIFTVVAEEWPEPKGQGLQTMTVLDCPEWVNIVPVTPQGRVLLIRQPRVGSRRVELEIPGGAVSRRDASPLAAGKRELLEETGYAASRWVSLGWAHPNPAFHRNHCHMVLALGVHKVAAPALEFGEDIAIVSTPLARIPGLIARGKIRHALVIVALHAALAHPSLRSIVRVRAAVGWVGGY